MRVTNSSSLTIDNTTNGYYSSVNPDPMQRFAWELISSWTTAKFVGTDVSGNTVQYVIHRMCTLPGQPTNATGQLCGTSSMSGSTTSLAGPSEGASFAAGASVFATAPQTYYRVIVRSTGPRNAVSYVQAMVLI